MQSKIRDGHPRVLVRPDDLPALRRRAATTHAREYQRLLDLADAGPVPAGNGEDYHDSVWRLAFLHLLSGDHRHARLASEGLHKLLELPVSGEYFVGARRLKALATSYDWMHAALDPALREYVGRQALAYCQALYDSEEIEPGSCYLAGHAINQMPFVLMAAIGVGDEIAGAGEQTQRLIDDMLVRTDRQFACYRHFLEKDCFPQSMTYTCTYVGEFPYLFGAFEAGLGIEMYRPHAYFANVIKWWTYGMRDDETFLRFGDYFCAVPVLENGQYYRAFAAVASRYRDGLAQWWVDRFRMDESGVEPDQILFEDRPGVARKSPEDLPRTKFFGPMGLAVARGDFDPRGGAGGAGGTVASFKCTPLYLHNHGHRDANSIAIYHKTDLAVDSGAYDSYETPHWYNYFIRTIAHNTVVIHDPQEKFVSRGKEYSNDGGQRFINEPHFAPRTIEDVLGETFRDGKILACRDGDGFSYVCGDASNCYSKSKLKKFLRHVTFVLDHPAKGCVSMLVLDEIELAKDGLEPRFLLHTCDEPKVSDNTIAVGRSGQERGGRLTATVLLPRSPRIDTIGGEGLEFEVDGTNYALSRRMNGPYVPGAWRAEVIGSGEGHTRRFLTLLVPADADAAAEPAATLEESPNGLLVRQGDLSIVLVRGGKQIATDARRAIRIELAN